MTVPGGSALNYPPNTQPPIKRVTQNRAPTTNDYRNFREGDEWLDKSSDDWWKLADITGTTALWVKIGGTPTAAETLTGDSGGAVPPDGANNINVFGTGSIVTTGNPGTNTLTIGDAGDVATTYTEDTGTATPAANNLNVVGTNGITTSGAADTVTITSNATFTEDSGSASFSSGNLNILGTGGLTTSGASSTVTVTTDGTIATSYPCDSGTAIPSSGVLNVNSTATGFLNTSGASNTISLNINDFVDAAVNNWTPVIQGSSTPGVGTYTRQHAVYMRLGKLVIATFDLVWTAHTGTGNMQVAGWPATFALSSSEYVGTVLYENLTLPASTIQVILNGTNATTVAEVTALIDAAGRSQVQMDTAATLSGTLIYFSNA